MDASGIVKADLNELEVAFKNIFNATKVKMETVTGESQ